MTENLADIVEPLLAWYRENRRILPWREQTDPYRIWISEIMLQQTRVETVKPYYERFVAVLPDVRAAAACEEETILKLWEGLGYYSRARNIRKAAGVIISEYGGVFPDRYETLLKLPGIGEYTAGSIASIAFGEPVPAVDGNVMRVISRITEQEEDVLKQSARRNVREALCAVMPAREPGFFNQALMELGAVVCWPNGMPDCGACPVRERCLAFQHGRQRELPVRKKAGKRRIENRTVLVIHDGERFAIRKRPEKGLLAGLYEFPNYTGELNEKQVLELVREQGLYALQIRPLPESRHIFSHVEWHMTGYLVRVSGPEAEEKGNLLFVKNRNAEEHYPLPSAFAAYARYLNLRMGLEKDTGGTI